MVKVALLGHGIVGSGVAGVLLKNAESFAKRAGKQIEIKYILDLRDFDLPYKDKFVKDFSVIVNDPEVEIVAEMLGGLSPAYDFTKACILAGKSVVTSNKEVVAEKGAELLKLARENKVSYLFEASVGGGIPIIRPLHQCLAANQIDEIEAILNGTTNYILTEMFKNYKSFGEALIDAQQKGYAEKDPSADVDGIDACRKICILSSLAFGRHIYPKSVSTEGISGITNDDVACAASWGGTVKLVCCSKKIDGKVYASVSPRFVRGGNPLYNVDDVFNAIVIKGDAIGDVMFYGRGAGQLPTASAVAADIIDIVRNVSSQKTPYWVDGDENDVGDIGEIKNKYFVRGLFADKTKAEKFIKQLFGEVSYIVRDNAPEDEVAFITKNTYEKEFLVSYNKIKNNSCNFIRVL